MAEAPKKSSLLKAAVEALTQGNHGEAIKCCKQALKQDRCNYDAYLVLGKALFSSKQYDQADVAYRRAVDINSSGLRAWQGLAELHEATGDVVKVVEVCEAIIKICKASSDSAHLADYTRRLAVAHATKLNHEKASDAWQAVLDMPSIPEALQLEALCGVVDAEIALLECHFQEECTRQLAGEEQHDAGSVRRALEEEWAGSEHSMKIEAFLQEIVKQLPQIQKYENLLLHLLLYRMRANPLKGQKWKQTRVNALQQCFSILSVHLSDLALEVLFAMCEEDDMEDLFEEVRGEELPKDRQKRILWIANRYAHIYPNHGLLLSAVTFAMHSSSHSFSLEHKRSCCERALRAEENSILGWQVLAELRAAEGAHANAVECVRRGLAVISRLRTLYGLSLRCAELQLHMTLADTLLKMRSYHEADEAFQQINEATEQMQSAEGYAMRVLALEGQVKVCLADGKAEEASTRLSSLLAVDASNSWALGEQGWLAFQNGSLDHALNLLQQAVALKSDDARNHYRLGIVYWKAGSILQSHKEAASGHLIESARLDPGQPEVFRMLGHYYKEVKGDKDRAVRCYRKAVLLSPEDEEAGVALCNILDSGGQELLQIAVCREASQRSQSAFWAWCRLGYIQVCRRDWSDAIGNLQHAIRGYPTCGDVWEALGLAYQQLGMLTAALKAYGRVIALESSCLIFSLQQSGIILLSLGSYKKAEAMFWTALDKAPEHAAAQYGLGLSLLGQARECIAIGAFGWSANLLKDASRIVLQGITNYGHIAALWKLLGDIEVAYVRSLPWKYENDVSKSDFVNEASKINGFEEYVPGKFKRSLDSWNQHRLLAAKTAKRAYQQALHLQPCHGNLYGDLCLSLSVVASIDKGSNFFLSAWSPAEMAAFCGLRLEGCNSDLWTALGVLGRHKGLRQQALIHALHMDGNHAVAWAHLGQLYLKEGQEELARQAFDRARSADPTLALTWAGMSLIYSLKGSDCHQEAFSSCLYAVHLSPAADFQLGLARLATSTQQLHLSQVYAAIEQAVLQAPQYAETHNFKGLACEIRGKLKDAIVAFRLARDALNLSSPSKLSLSDCQLAISINLARVLCKAGEVKDAVVEYELLAKSGKLEDSCGLRSYAVALWQLGKRNLAIAMTKKAVKVSENPSKSCAAMTLLCKFIYLDLGPTSAINEIKNAPESLTPNMQLMVTALALGCAGRNDEFVSSLISGSDVLARHEQACRLFALIAQGRQVSQEGTLDYEGAIQTLQRAIHMYPQNLLIRRKLAQTLLEESNGRKAKLSARCCFAEPAEKGLLCGVLGAAATACSACGGLKPQFTFSTCSFGSNSLYATLRELQSWLHIEPWNLMAHYHLVLCLMQQAREQKFPSHISQTLQRITSIILSRFPTGDGDGPPWEYMRLQLMLCSSECALQSSNLNVALENAKSAIDLNISGDEKFLAHLQLARCFAGKEDISSSEAECQICQEIGTRDSFAWLSLMDLKSQLDLQRPNISLFMKIDHLLEGKPPEDKRVWKALLQYKRAEIFFRAQDIISAEKAAAQASSIWPEAIALHLLHGVICMEIVKSGSNSQFLPSAIRSLSRVQYGGKVVLPVACLLLAQAEAGKVSGVSKWEKHIRAEWDVWHPDLRPAELYFQMGLLVKQSKAMPHGDQNAPESLQSTRSWLKRAVHLNPACFRYWMMLQRDEGNGVNE